MITAEKLEQFNAKALLLAVQKISLQFLEAESKKKKLTTAAMRRQLEGLEVMRSALKSKLMRMDRNSQAFFPIGTHVRHTPPSLYAWDDFNHPEEPQKNAVVLEHLPDGRIKIQREGEGYQLKVWPAHLMLRFISDNK